MGDSARSLRVLLPENEFAFPLPLFLSSHLPLVCFSCSLLSISVCVQQLVGVTKGLEESNLRVHGVNNTRLYI